MDSPKTKSKPIQIPTKNNEVKILFTEIERSRENLKQMFGLSKTPEGGLYADKSK